MKNKNMRDLQKYWAEQAAKKAKPPKNNNKTAAGKRKDSTPTASPAPDSPK